MASNSEWKEDNLLENDLRKYVGQNVKRSEILDFVQRDFPEYTWSTATLDRRLRHFGIYYSKRKLTGLHDSYSSWHLYILPFSSRSLDLFLASLLFRKGTSFCVIGRK